MQEKLATRRLREKERELERQKEIEAERLRRLEVAKVESEQESKAVPTMDRLRGLLRFRRGGREEAPATTAEATVEVETAPTIDAAPRGKAARSMAAPQADTVNEPATIEMAAPPKRRGKKEPLIESVVELPPQIDVVAPIEAFAEASTARPEPTKKGLFSRFRKEKPAPGEGPMASVEAEGVEMAPISIDTETTAAPAPKPVRHRRGGRDREAPQALFEELSIEAPAAAPQKSAKKAKREAATVEVEIGDVMAPAPAVVEMGDVGLESPAASVEEGAFSIGAAVPAAPKKRRGR